MKNKKLIFITGAIILLISVSLLIFFSIYLPNQKIAKAEELIEEEKYEEAKELLEELVAANGRNEEASKLLTLASSKLEMMQIVEDELRTISEMVSQKKYEEALRPLRLLQEKYTFEGARDQFLLDKLVELTTIAESALIESRLKHAQTLMDEGKVEQARDELAALLGMEFTSGEIDAKLEQVRNAYDQYEQLDRVTASLERAEEFLQQRDAVKVQQELEPIRGEVPLSDEAGEKIDTANQLYEFVLLLGKAEDAAELYENKLYHEALELVEWVMNYDHQYSESDEIKNVANELYVDITSKMEAEARRYSNVKQLDSLYIELLEVNYMPMFGSTEVKYAVMTDENASYRIGGLFYFVFYDSNDRVIGRVQGGANGKRPGVVEYLTGIGYSVDVSGYAYFTVEEDREIGLVRYPNW